MRILYLGHLDPGGTCRDRMMSLQRLQHEVMGLDLSTLQSTNRIVRSLQWRSNHPSVLEGLNRRIVEFAENVGRADWCWIDKGVWIFPETLAAIRKTTGGGLIHYTPDSQFIVNRSRIFFDGVPSYDLLVTTKAFEVDDYRRVGARQVRLVTQSFCPIRFASPEPRAEYVHDVGFVSDFKPHYGRVIRGLRSEIADIGVWGPRWRRAACLGRAPRDVVKGDGLWGADYVNGLASFKIGLGLLSKYIPEQHTTRSFEIPATGTFLLAERSSEHEQFFREGEEAEFFDSPEELASKARYYLAHEDARERIAARGRARVWQGGMDNDSVLRGIVEALS